MSADIRNNYVEHGEFMAIVDKCHGAAPMVFDEAADMQNNIIRLQQEHISIALGWVDTYGWQT